MRISFDLDDTLICYQAGVPHERNAVPLAFRWWMREPLRLGAAALLRDLSVAGHDLWVYTTSFRSPAAVRWWHWWYGVRVRNIINQSRHERYFGRQGPSKNPARLGIDLHVDDSWGVWVEGRQHQFRVAVVLPDDLEWADKIRAAVVAVGRGEDPDPPPDLPESYASLVRARSIWLNNPS